VGVPAHRNLLCLEEKRPPEREGPRERHWEGAEGKGRVRDHGRPRRSMQDTWGHNNEKGGQRARGQERDTQEER
jgi:hypothetical protein